jgi:hypothetical protein
MSTIPGTGSHDKHPRVTGPRDPLTGLAALLAAIAPCTPPDVAHALYITAAALPLVKPAARFCKRMFSKVKTG